MKTLEGFLVLCLLSAACLQRPAASRSTPPLVDEGALYIYLQPLPRDAQNVSFVFEEMAAVREEGGEVPLGLHPLTIAPDSSRRERLIATGALPPGRYAGFSVRIRQAELHGQTQAQELRVPEEALRVPAPFAIVRQQAVVLDLAVGPGAVAAPGGRFEPSFSVAAPVPIATALIAAASSRGGNAVVVFDKVSGRVVAVVPTGRQPAGMALDEPRRRLYVAISGEDAIAVIDLLESRIIDHVKLTAGDGPLEIALTPDGATLLTANTGSNTVSFIDTKGLFEANRVPVGNGPSSVLLDRAGRRAFVFNTLSDSVTVLNVPGGGLAGTIATDSEPFRGQLSEEGNRLFVVHRSAPYMTTVDAVSLAVIRRTYVGSEVTALRVDPRTGRIYLAHRGSGAVDVYDPFSLLPIESIRTDADTGYLAIDGENNALLAVLPRAGAVRTLGLVGKRTSAESEVGEDPCWVSLMGER